MKRQSHYLLLEREREKFERTLSFVASYKDSFEKAEKKDAAFACNQILSFMNKLNTP